MKSIMLCSVFFLALTAPIAQANALFDFSYTTGGGGVLAGTLEGTLQADNNTVEVVSVLDFVTFNGVAGPALRYVYSGNFPNIPGVVTLDGSTMDLLVCINVDCLGTLFTFYDAGLGPTQFFGTSDFGGLQEDFSADRWSLTAVPVPGSLALVGLGLAGVSLWRRRRIPAACCFRPSWRLVRMSR